MDANNELDILGEALTLVGSVLREDKEQLLKYLTQLKRWEYIVQYTALEAHSEVKRLTLLTIISAIRFVEHNKQSDYELTMKNGRKAAIELSHLNRLAQRFDAK